jgi:type IV pilus assembly protein PilO
MAIGGKVDLNQMLKRLETLPALARLGILGGIALLIVGVYVFTLFGGARTRLQALDKQLAKVQAEIQSARAVVSNLDSFKKEQEGLKKQLEAALRKLPNSSEIPQLLTDITSLGKKAGLEIRSFKRGDKISRGFYSEQKILLEFRGHYHDIGVFFDRLAGLSRIVSITTLNMKASPSGEGGNPWLDVSGVASTYFFNEANAAGAGGGN